MKRIIAGMIIGLVIALTVQSVGAVTPPVGIVKIRVWCKHPPTVSWLRIIKSPPGYPLQKYSKGQ